MTQTLYNFKSTLEVLPEEYLTKSHTLVFPVFMAAFESVSTENKVYFSQILKRQSQHLGFANILTALEYLNIYWEGRTSSNWVDVITKYNVWIF